jgi:hypothetical protein
LDPSPRRQRPGLFSCPIQGEFLAQMAHLFAPDLSSVSFFRFILRHKTFGFQWFYPVRFIGIFQAE